MTSLSRAENPWVWGPEQHFSFNTVRDEIAEPGRAHKRFNPNLPLYVHTDWSVNGIGAVLGQMDGDGLEYIVACASRSLNRHEANYLASKGECLAAVYGVQIFCFYTTGRRIMLVTDHQPLTSLLTSSVLTGALSRWSCILQAYDIQVVHRAGILHQNADALSRFPHSRTEDQTGSRIDHDIDPVPALLLWASPASRAADAL